MCVCPKNFKDKLKLDIFECLREGGVLLAAFNTKKHSFYLHIGRKFEE